MNAGNLPQGTSTCHRDRTTLFARPAPTSPTGTKGKPNPRYLPEKEILALRFNLAALHTWRENHPIIA